MSRQAKKVAEGWEVVFIGRGSGEATRPDCGGGWRGYSDALAKDCREAREDDDLTVEPEQDDDPVEIPGFLAPIRSERAILAGNEDGDR